MALYTRFRIHSFPQYENLTTPELSEASVIAFGLDMHQNGAYSYDQLPYHYPPSQQQQQTQNQSQQRDPNNNPAQPQQTLQSGFRTNPRNQNPSFRYKIVYELYCAHCSPSRSTLVCTRAMKAVLLADKRVELFSTDAVPLHVETVNNDYTARYCNCQLRDFACLQCGNVLGYHVCQPCFSCLAGNNGMYWMFGTDAVEHAERMTNGPANGGGDVSSAAGGELKPLLWSNLPAPEPVGRERGAER